MKVCFVLHSSALGGAERSNLELMDGLRNQKVECFAILPSYGPLIKELEKRGVSFKVLPYKWWMGKEGSPHWKRVGRLALNLAMILPVVIQIRKWEINVIVTNTITVCVGAIAAKILGIPHIWYIREFGYKDHRLVFDLGEKFSLWLMDRLTSVFIANSHAVAREYARFIPAQKIKVVYQSVNIEVQSSPGSEVFNKQTDKRPDFRCVIVGNLQEGKRQEDAIRAIAELLNRGIRAELLIVGGGDPIYRKYLHNIVRENGLDNRVKFIGYVDNPIPFMQMADVVLMCSIYEAFGRVTIEAMKVGKPVIGARSGGTVELIRDGFNGLLYTPGDYKELAEKIKYLYDHRDVALQMGEKCRRWAMEQFTEEVYAERVLTILREVA